MNWNWYRFDVLSAGDLHDWLALRSRVFIVEQKCPYLDPDGLDRASWHLLGRGEGGVLMAGLRIVDPGAKYEEPSIGRVVTALEARRVGIGRALMQQGLAFCGVCHSGRDIRIGAQAYLERFYSSLGFERIGADYDEDGIPHVEMLRRA